METDARFAAELDRHITQGPREPETCPGCKGDVYQCRACGDSFCACHELPEVAYEVEGCGAGVKLKHWEELLATERRRDREEMLALRREIDKLREGK